MSRSTPKGFPSYGSEVLYFGHTLSTKSQYPEGFPKLWEKEPQSQVQLELRRSTPKGFPSYGRCLLSIHIYGGTSQYPEGFPKLWENLTGFNIG